MTELINLNEAGVAIGGYDPVSYFTGSPTPGDANITSIYQGATYQFASAKNKAEFDANPQQYIPEYGGFCAVAISEGKTFPVDPKTYLVSDDRLYLFYNGKLGNTKPQWEADPANRQSNADTYWQNGDLKVVYPAIEY